MWINFCPLQCTVFFFFLQNYFYRSCFVLYLDKQYSYLIPYLCSSKIDKNHSTLILNSIEIPKVFSFIGLVNGYFNYHNVLIIIIHRFPSIFHKPSLIFCLNCLYSCTYLLLFPQNLHSPHYVLVILFYGQLAKTITLKKFIYN